MKVRAASLCNHKLSIGFVLFGFWLLFRGIINYPLGDSGPAVYVAFRSTHDRQDQATPLEKITGEKRANIVQNMCLTRTRVHIYSYKRNTHYAPGYHAAYCDIPKVACTFWKRAFIRMNYNGTKPLKDLDLRRGHVHISYKLFLFNNTLERDTEHNAFKFMFIREPFGRLWSAYVDKYFLSDFWGMISNVLHDNNRTGCGSDVTFKMFLNHIIVTYRKYNSSAVLNPHWAPMNIRCDPCAFQPDFIGSLDTFGSDVWALWSRLNITIPMDVDRDSQTQEMVYLFHDQWRKSSQCDVASKEMSRRLWSAFQFQGLISNEATFSDDVLPYIDYWTIQRVLPFFLDARDKYPLSDEDRHAQKLMAIKEAYREIPFAMKSMLVDIYRHDFELFGYEKFPSFAFS